MFFFQNMCLFVVYSLYSPGCVAHLGYKIQEIRQVEVFDEKIIKILVSFETK